MSSPIMLITVDKEKERWVKAALRGTHAHVASVCGSSRSAQEFMAKNPVSLVIMDLFLPDDSGLDVLKTLKRMNEECQVVLLTRVHTRSVLERAFRLGAHDVLIYPLSSDIFKETILHRLANQPVEEIEEEPAP